MLAPVRTPPFQDIGPARQRAGLPGDSARRLYNRSMQPLASISHGVCHFGVLKEQRSPRVAPFSPDTGLERPDDRLGRLVAVAQGAELVANH